MLYAFTGNIRFAIPIYHVDMVSRGSHPNRSGDALGVLTGPVMLSVDQKLQLKVIMKRLSNPGFIGWGKEKVRGDKKRCVGMGRCISH